MRNRLFTKIAAVAMMATAATFTSCDDDEDVKFVPLFPESAQTFYDAESCTLTFTANDVWTLSSDATWAVFENGSTTTQGEAGEQSVKVKVTLSRENAGKTANVTLAYPNAPETTMVIATISQSPWVNEVKLVNAESISVGYAGTTIKFYSNIDCAAKELPSFLTFNGKNSLELKAGETEVVIAYDENEIETQAPNEKWNGKIEFFEENGDAAVAAINIEYTGMAAGEIIIDVEAQFGWTVDFTSQGDHYYREMSGTKMNAYEEGIPFTVYAGEDVVFLHAVYVGGKYWYEEVDADSQIGVETFEKGYRFFIWSTVTDKLGELYAVPTSVFEKMNQDELFSGIESEGYIDDQYFVLRWEMASTGSVDFKDGLSLQPITFEISEWGVEMGSIEAGHSVIVTVPNFNVEDFENHLIGVSLISTDGTSEKNLIEEGKVEPMESGFLISTDASMADNVLNIFIGTDTYYIYVYSAE